VLDATAALATAMEGLLVINRAGRFTYANPAAERLFGLPVGKIVGAPLSTLRTRAAEGVSAGKVELPAARVLRTGVPVASAEHVVERPDGTSSVVLQTATAVRDERGDLEGAAISLQEVTNPASALQRAQGAESAFRSFMESSPDGLLMHRAGRLVFVNGVLLQTLGYGDAKDVVGRAVLDFVHPEDREAVRERIRALVEEGKYAPVREERLLHREGKPVEVTVSAVPIAYEGEPTILVMVIDVSEHRRVQRELDGSVSLLRATLESTADGLLVVDERGRISAYNEKFVQMWRMPREIMDARDDQRALAFVLDQLTDPDAFLRRTTELYDHPDASSHEMLELTDGRVYERYSQPQRVGGRCIGRVWSFRDVTERRRAEAERERLLAEQMRARQEMEALAAVAQRQAAELEHIHSSMADSVVVCDMNGQITHVNEAETKLTGVPIDEILGNSLADYARLVALRHLDGRPLPAAELPLARALSGETVINAALWSERSGRKVYMRSNATPIRDASGEIVGAVAVERDVSSAVEFDMLKDQFIRVAAHELKTPVAIMKGYADLLLRSSERLPPALAGSLEAIERGAGRIDRLVGDLLDVSQLQLGRMEIRREKVDVAELVDVVTRRVALTTKKHEIRVTESEPVVVQADRARLERVLDKLLDNAVRYSPRGGGVEVSVCVRDDHAQVCVCDHGVGIARSKQGRIFERFYRAHTDTPHDYGGMGVGLYISREIIAQHGGTMWFSSEEGRGSEFCFRLPVKT
jgi:PAS domain S-box-containing protein